MCSPILSAQRIPTSTDVSRSVLTREQAIANFQALLPDADALVDHLGRRQYGDIWCFCIDYSQQPNAVLSLVPPLAGER